MIICFGIRDHYRYAGDPLRANGWHVVEMLGRPDQENCRETHEPWRAVRPATIKKLARKPPAQLLVAKISGGAPDPERYRVGNEDPGRDAVHRPECGDQTDARETCSRK